MYTKRVVVLVAMVAAVVSQLMQNKGIASQQRLHGKQLYMCI